MTGVGQKSPRSDAVLSQSSSPVPLDFDLWTLVVLTLISSPCDRLSPPASHFVMLSSPKSLVGRCSSAV